MAGKDDQEEQLALELERLRMEIDRADLELLQALGTRMKTVDRIGRVKAQHGMPLLQKGRFAELLAKRLQQGERAGLSAGFVEALFELIHEEALRIQGGQGESAAEKRKEQ